MTDERALFDTFPSTPDVRDGVRAKVLGDLVTALSTSSAWGEVPVTAELRRILAAVPESHGWPIIELEPFSPRELRLSIPLRGASADPARDFRPTLQGVARALGLSAPRVRAMPEVATGAGLLRPWALCGLPEGVELFAFQDGPALKTVSTVRLLRPQVPQREEERGTTALATELKRASAEADPKLPALKRLETKFLVEHGTVHTGVRWIRLESLVTALGLPPPEVARLELPRERLRSESEHFSTELGRLRIEATLSSERWVKRLSCAVTPQSA